MVKANPYSREENAQYVYDGLMKKKLTLLAGDSSFLIDFFFLHSALMDAGGWQDTNPCASSSFSLLYS